MILFAPAILLLVLAMALGLYAGRSANLKVRRFFWYFLASGLIVSALALGILGEWWLVFGPMIPLVLILLLRIRFPFLFGVFPPTADDTAGTKEDNGSESHYNDGHDNVENEREDKADRTR